MTITLRPYQEEAVAAIQSAWDRGTTRPAVVMSTGLGKTVVFSSLICQQLPALVAKGERALVIAHRGELLEQAAEKIRAACPSATVGIVKGSRDESEWADVIVASMQTLAIAKRRERIKGIGMVVVDECHNSGSKSYLDVLNHYGCFESTPTVGFTATMTRMDGGLPSIWQETCYERGTAWAIEEGYLVPAQGLSVQVDSFNLANTRVTAGDLNAGDVAQALMESDAFEMISAAYIEHAKDRPGIVFMPNVATAEEMSGWFNRSGIVSELITGAMSATARADVYRRYREGAVQVLTSVMVLTEGFDAPHTSCVVVARPTLSPSLWCLDDQTEILTDRGWLGPDDSLDGARPAAFDLSDGSVHWSPLLARVDRPLTDDESMYGLSSPTADIRVSDRHRMVWRGRRQTAWKVSEARELARLKSDYRIPIAGLQDAPGVPLTNDEIRFVGWFMTDGTYDKSTRKVSIIQAEHQPWNADIVACLKGCGFKYAISVSNQKTQFNRTSPTLRYSVSYGAPRGTDKHLRGWGDLDGYLSKDLSPKLEDLTRDQLAVLLHAMHLGDGSKQVGQSWTRRSYHISTGNKMMADRLQSLCVRRGFKCNVAVHTYNTNPLYVLHIKDVSWKSIGGTSQGDRESFVQMPHSPGERVWCVETDAGTVITRRNGKVAILGNCQMVGRGLRLFPGKEDCLVMDVAGAAQRHTLACVNDLNGECTGKCECTCLKCGCTAARTRLVRGKSIPISGRCKCRRGGDCGCPCMASHKAPGEGKECPCSGAPECGCDEHCGGCGGCLGASEVEAKQVSAKDLAFTEISLLDETTQKSRFNWLTTQAGIRFLPVGDRQFLFTFPDPGNPDPKNPVMYAMGMVEGTKAQKLGESLRADQAIHYLEQHADRLADRLAQAGKGSPFNMKSGSWRRTPASSKQLDLLMRMGQEITPGMKKGEAADRLSVYMGTRALDPRFGKYAAK